MAARAPLGTGRRERPLRVAQVLGRLGGGGAQQLALNLAIALTDAGIDSTAIALKRSALGEESRPVGTTRVVELGIDDRRKSSLITGAWRLRRFIARHRIDVLHIHGSASLPFCAMATRGMRRRPRLHFTWHDSGSVLEQESPRKRKMMLAALRRCEGIYGSSSSVAERLQQAMSADGQPDARAYVFRNGVPLTEPAPAVTARGGGDAELNGPARPSAPGHALPTLLWMGRLVPPKDPEALIRVAGRLWQEGLRFRVIMAGSAPAHLAPFAERLRTLVRDLGFEETIEFPGWVDDPAPLLDRSTVGVQTSLTEGLSIALLEQMMAGLPVVATNVGDTAAAVVDGESGFVIPPKDDDRLFAALRSLLTDETCWQSMSRASRARAVGVYSLPVMAACALRAYTEGPATVDMALPGATSGPTPPGAIGVSRNVSASSMPATDSTKAVVA